MKLSISYNFFNGEEHLYSSILNIKPAVDHISICFQEVSNFGEDISPQAKKVLERLKKEGLVDEYYNLEQFEKVKTSLNNFKFGKQFDFAGLRTVDIIEVDNIFNLNINYKKKNN